MTNNNIICIINFDVQYEDWSVMLRKNLESNSNTRNPASCHGAIPSLSPGRYLHATTSLDYYLLVCGGMFSK